MGRITVFTDQLCIESLRVKELLELKGISYLEIDLSVHPDRRLDMVNLTSRQSTPQIFVNCYHVAKSTAQLQQLLQEWVMTYGTISEAQKILISNFVVSDPRLRAPVKTSIVRDPHKKTFTDLYITLPHGDRVGIAQMTAMLLLHMPKNPNNHNMIQGYGATVALKNWLKLTEKHASEFGNRLITKGLIKCVSDPNQYELNTSSYYRLQALENPQVLNLHCPPPSIRTISHFVETTPLSILTRLCHLMQYVYSRYPNRKERLESKEYGNFQCHVGHLRKMRWDSLSTAEHINLYNLMVRHGLLEYPSWNDTTWPGMMGIIQYEFQNEMIVSLADLSSRLLPVPKLKGWKRILCGPKQRRKQRLQSAQVRDPRIQFALFMRCGSSPRICRIYSRENLDWELEETTRYYLQTAVRVLDDRIILPCVTLQKRMEWLVGYLSPDQLVSLQDLHTRYPNGLNMIVDEFDWSRIEQTYPKLSEQGIWASTRKFEDSNTAAPGDPARNVVSIREEQHNQKENEPLRATTVVPSESAMPTRTRLSEYTQHRSFQTEPSRGLASLHDRRMASSLRQCSSPQAQSHSQCAVQPLRKHRSIKGQIDPLPMLDESDDLSEETRLHNQPLRSLASN